MHELSLLVLPVHVDTSRDPNISHTIPRIDDSRLDYTRYRLINPSGCRTGRNPQCHNRVMRARVSRDARATLEGPFW